MSRSELPCLTLSIDRLTASEKDKPHFAIWVLKAPFPGGYVHHDRIWPDSLTQAWQTWQSMFSLRGLPEVPPVPPDFVPKAIADLSLDNVTPNGQAATYSSRLMQMLGILLWQWLFDGPIQSSLDQGQGLAIGQRKPLRLRLEVRDPDLIALPWEIMQPQTGCRAISLNQQLLFSRTTSVVDPLSPPLLQPILKILLVLGENSDQSPHMLSLDQEAETLANVLGNASQTGSPSSSGVPSVPCQVDTLVQPTPAELTHKLESGGYNVFFYAGHGVPAPDGGLLFLRSGVSLNGTELAQVLTRCRVTLAVFNACWGAQPDQMAPPPDASQGARAAHRAIPRSSLAEVLIHHGVPAVLGMRDSIADQEALSFVQVFAQALAERHPIDESVAIARQHLLTLYKFNQPAWTLPVLYMHPEFDGELLRQMEEGITELPHSPTWIGVQAQAAIAALRTTDSSAQVWPIRGGLMRVGRRTENDLVIQERWVSQRHAEIFCRELGTSALNPTYFLRDFSRYGTLVSSPEGWQRIHQQEVPLHSGTRLRFGSSQGQELEFVVEPPEGAAH
ncbi:CHAT domain-containing protein [Geitlerinema sp. PCC 7407]|uniref:CHAT domain-containing protein n=1 Tax=Geitlerinema sp. PCC 7407 TaxID=1173025 RepID=UPI00029F821A|nr:CHAT domain-containing protein [Geitlerinema sp. PCC 7407]AFY67886.1 Forkhead-associated protein [Geitlerinema sp. PCC 7407]